MKIAANKCTYIIFSKGISEDFSLPLWNCPIPRSKSTKFLGVTLDEKLNFKDHISEIRSKCFDRMKIIKILSHKSWRLTPNVLGRIYKTLIGSVIDYSFFLNILETDNNTEFKRIQVIQNKAIRTIYKLPYDCPNNVIAEYEQKIKINRLATRYAELANRYICNCIIYENPLIIILIREYLRGFTAREITIKTPLCLSNELFKLNMIV